MASEPGESDVEGPSSRPNAVNGPVVLVTGAGGFIGGRIVEYLDAAGYRVRAGLRRWANGARPARRSVELVLCDVLDGGQVQEAMVGVDAVVHCAVGGEKVTVEGTKNVLEQASREKLNRVVHFSTVEVYGNQEGDVSEEAPLQKTGNPYGDSKVEAERLCRRYSEHGVPVSVLRPTIVYGPFSDLWTVRPARRIHSAGWSLPKGAGQGYCNLVYVDDVARLAEHCLRREAAVGEAFNANGNERVTWRDYITGLREALGVSAPRRSTPAATRLRALALAPVRAVARYAMDRFGDLVMEAYARSRLAKRVMKKVEATLKTSPSSDELDLYERKAFYPNDKAREMLGFTPRFGMERGLDRSVAWLEHHGVLEAE